MLNQKKFGKTKRFSYDTNQTNGSTNLTTIKQKVEFNKICQKTR